MHHIMMQKCLEGGWEWMLPVLLCLDVYKRQVYPHPPQNRYDEAAETLRSLAARYKAECCSCM